MSIRVQGLARGFQGAMLAAMLLFPFAATQAQAPAAAPASAPAPAKSGGARAFWCKSPNGVAVMQLESCAPGTELRSEPVGPHGAVPPKPAVATPVEPLPPAEIQRRTQAAAQRGAAPDLPPVGPAARLPGPGAVKTGLLWLFILLGLGLVAGLAGRQMEKPFWRSAAVGGALWLLLLAVKLVRG